MHWTWLRPTLVGLRAQRVRSLCISPARGVSVEVADVSPENLWLVMRRKVKQPGQFLPGMNLTVETYESVKAHLRTPEDPIWRCLTFEAR